LSISELSNIWCSSCQSQDLLAATGCEMSVRQFRPAKKKAATNSAPTLWIPSLQSAIGATGSRIVALENPVMVRMVLEPPLAHRPCHHVQVIHLVAVGCAAGMMPFRHQNQIVVRNRHGLIQRTVLGEDTL